MEKKTAEIFIRGLGVSPGLAVGPAFFTTTFFYEPTEDETIAPAEVDKEWQRFETALGQTRDQLQALLGKAANSVGMEQAGIFDAHLLMAEDPTLLAQVKKLILTEYRTAEAAFYQATRRYVEAMKRIDDEYLRERLADLEDVVRRVLQNLRGGMESRHPKTGHVLLAHDLAPSETMDLDRQYVYGFATEAGSQTSHTAILARSLDIPAVVGMRDLHSYVQPGDQVLIDGTEGVFIVHPTEETVALYENAHRRRRRISEQLFQLRHIDSVTRDGVKIVVAANIESADEMPIVTEQAADGVGLVRTEFLFLERETPPDEEEQFEHYRRIAEAAGSAGAIIRTLDIGGDKMPSHDQAEPEANPFLGWRGIRRSLQEPALFKTQLRAILRASACGRVRLMYPLVSSLEEVRAAQTLLAQCQLELSEAGIAYDSSMEVGAMIEVPSAALSADLIASEVDFFSVGTNDLIQYTLAIDRINERVAHLYQPWHPAIFRLLQLVVEAAQKNGIWAGVCGEMAGDLIMTPLLVGLGFTELSVGSSRIPRLKHAVRTLDQAECAAMVEKLRRLNHPSDIYQRSRELARSYYAELLE
jgi:phosphoenolpyruvate-protein phosphotransferase (PTS system enzyme I)